MFSDSTLAPSLNKENTQRHKRDINGYVLTHRWLDCEVSWNVLTLHLPRSQTVPEMVSDHLQFRQLDGHATKIHDCQHFIHPDSC